MRKTPVGSGMTERTHSEYDNDHADMVAFSMQLRANRTEGAWRAFSDRLSVIEECYRGVLDAKGLPSNPEKRYQQIDGIWVETSGGYRLTDVVAMSRPSPDASDYYDPDSPEGYAAAAIDKVQYVKAAIQAGEAEQAALFAFELGSLLTEQEMKGLERDWLAGHKIRTGKETADAAAKKKREPTWRRIFTEAAGIRRQPGFAKSPLAKSQTALALKIKTKLNIQESIKTIIRHMK